MITFSESQMLLFGSGHFYHKIKLHSERLSKDYQSFYNKQDNKSFRKFVQDGVLYSHEMGFYSEKAEYLILRMCVEFGADFDLRLEDQSRNTFLDKMHNDQIRLNCAYEALQIAKGM